MASGPITLWQINGETMETEADFIFLGSNITANVDCSHETKKSYTISEKPSTTSSLTTLKYLTVWITINCGKFFQRWEYQTTLLAS